MPVLPGKLASILFPKDQKTFRQVNECPGNTRRVYRNEENMAACPEYIRLRSEVENILANLAQVTTLLLELFRSDNSDEYKHLDKELELTVGEKERAVGALRQHIKEHKCQPEEHS